MKLQFKKTTAVAMAMTMCVSGVAMAADPTPTPAPINGETAGSFNTSFDVYSPALHISVPLKADIQVNPMANPADASVTGIKQFTVASNSIDVINASVDTEADAAIPVNVTVTATITGKGEDVLTEYNNFIADPTSVKKKINLNLTQAATAAVLDETNRAPLTGGKLLDLSSVPVKTAAVYTGATNKTAITKYGSLMSIDIPVPTLEGGATSFTTDPTKVKATVGSFAVTGVANTNADWKKEDVAVAITYNVKASKALDITTPTATVVASDSATDVTITISDVGESTVAAIAIHNDEAEYGDFVLEGYKVEYVANSGATDAKITIPASHATLAFLADEASGCEGEPQDLVIGLSDGRRVVSTLTISAPNTP